MTSGKYARFFEDEVFSRWFRNLARGSPITAEVAVRRLGRLCEMLETSPGGLVSWAGRDVKGLQDSLEDLVDRLEDEGKAPSYISGILKAVRSWLKYNDIKLTRTIKISNPNATPTIEDEQVPSTEELSRIFRASSPRVRVAEAFIAFADLRLQALGNYNGSDGLMLKDLPELKIQNGEIIFEKKPTMVLVRSTLSKAGHKYFSFLTDEGCVYLKEYLEQRLRLGETLTRKTPIIAHQRTTNKSGKFLPTRKISHMIRTAMRRAGVYKRPYVLRAYAETQLIIAESKGKMSHPYLQFIAGHKGDIEARYSTNKGRLPPDMIESMRSSFKECEQYLTTTPKPEKDRKEMLLEMWREQAKMYGIDPMKVNIIEK